MSEGEESVGCCQKAPFFLNTATKWQHFRLRRFSQKRRASTGRWVTGPVVTVQTGVKSVFTPQSPRGLHAALISRSPGPDPAATPLWFARDSCPCEPYLPPPCWSVVTQLTGPPTQRGPWFVWFTFRRIIFNSLLILYVYSIKRRRYIVANNKWKKSYIFLAVLLKFTIRCKQSHLFPNTAKISGFDVHLSPPNNHYNVCLLFSKAVLQMVLLMSREWPEMRFGY